MGQGFVYVMGSTELGSVVKIGWSGAPEKRLKALQTGSPYLLTVRARHPGPIALETFLKDEFANMQMRGEWFDFGSVDPLSAIAKAVDRWPGDIRMDPQGVVYVFDESGLSAVPRESDASPFDRVLALHVYVPRQRGGVFRWARAKMAAYLGISNRTVATAMDRLIKAGSLIEAERHGRLTYYRASASLDEVQRRVVVPLRSVRERE